MRQIVKIAKAEFRSLFYTPILWLVLFFFLVWCGFQWFHILTYLTGLQDQDIDIHGATAYFAGEGFEGPLTHSLLGIDPVLRNGFMDIAVQCLYFFIPVLTMSVISREKNNGTGNLLFSSPVRTRQIVLGKYLGLVVFNLILVLFMLIFCVLTAVYTKSPDIGFMVSAVLGFYLLACTYSAIGMFMSSLTNYPVIAAIGCFLVLAFLNMAGEYFQRIDFVRDLTWFLSINNRAEHLFAGLVVSKDVLYFLLIIALFIGFTIIRLKGRQRAMNWFLTSRRYLAMIVVTLSLGYFFSRPALTLYWDATELDYHTITPEYQQILNNLGDDPVDITLYTNLLDGNSIHQGLPENRNKYLSALWEPFLRFKPDLRFHYEYYYNYDPAMDDSSLLKNHPGKSIDEIAAIKAKENEDIPLSLFSKPGTFSAEADLKQEQYRTVMRITWKNRSAFLRLSSSGTLPYPSNTIAAFNRVLTGTSPSVYFLTGNYERNIFKSGEREYGEHVANKGNHGSMVNTGYTVDTLSLVNRDIPEDADLIVVADPKSALSDTVQNKLKQYIEKGGNMFLLAEPGKQQIMTPVLKPLGIGLKPGQWVAEKSIGMGTGTAENMMIETTQLPSFLGDQFNKANWGMLTKPHNDRFFLLVGAAVPFVEDSSRFAIHNLMINLNPCYYKASPWTPDSLPPVFNASTGDTKENFSALLWLERKVSAKQQRILVSGDADFISNIRMPSTKFQPTMITMLYSWLTGFVYPIPFNKGREEENVFFDQMDTPKARKLELVLLWVLPSILVITGSILLIRRKRK